MHNFAAFLRSARLVLGMIAAGSIMTVPAGAATSPDRPSVWAPQPYTQHSAPAWSKDAVLYQINTRQFTAEGTFRAAERELPRLRALGVSVLWLMPIHPIGLKNRKGTLGSPYSVRDYYAVNPEFGTKADFKHFVDSAHAQGFHVILDWVANHTAWDNALASQHPDWYEKDWKGDFRPTPWLDWSDIIDLDWSKPGVREHVGRAMEMWVRDFGVDGFRADVAGYVPLDFWETERARLDRIRPVFMLAEWKTTELTRKAFDAVYAWDWHDTVVKIAKGQADATALYGYYAENESAWPAQAMRLTYIENHDSNAWDGSQYDNFHAALPAMTALAFTGEGLPMIYNGQEACNAKRLAFFDHDPIVWNQSPDCALGRLYADLIAFRHANPVLANGQWGARMQKVASDMPQQLFAWVRQKPGNKVLALFNLSARPVSAKLSDTLPAGVYEELAIGSAAPGRGPTKITIAQGDTISLPAWGFRLLAAREPAQ